MAELRQRAQRLLLPLPLRYRLGTAAEWLDGLTENISGSGILFATDRALLIGAKIELEVAMEADGECWPSALVARAQVVRVTSRSSPANTAIAARFVEKQLLPRHVSQD